MTRAKPNVWKTEQMYPVNLLSFCSDKSFDEVISDFEKQLGKFDQDQALSSSSDLTDSVKHMEGVSGLMVIDILEMDRLLPALISSSTRARQYLIGNPLIASMMAQHNTLAALYAPPRVLIYTKDGKTWISYDLPSTTFGRLASKNIFQIAKDLDQKFETLVLEALA
jgi:uncharacterized protein (DUF302 family)